MLRRAPDSRRARAGATDAYGPFDISDETVEDGNGQSKREVLMVLTLPTGALTLAEEDSVIIYSRDGTTYATYQVRDIRRVGDGLETQYRVVPS